MYHRKKFPTRPYFPMEQLHITTPHFAPEALEDIESTDPMVIIDQLSKLAEEDGFRLCRVSINRFPIELYCSKGGRKKGKTSKKTDCPFKLHIEYAKKTFEDGHVGRICRLAYDPEQLYHNHQLIVELE